MENEKRQEKFFYTVCPITLKAAREFVNAHHRHNIAPQGHKFSIALKADGKLIGVVIVGRPVARALDDGFTCEVTRCCVYEGYRNACTKLYGAALRAAGAMGYRRAVTYTTALESGSSLKAAGFTAAAVVRARDWNTPSRPRDTLRAPRYPVCEKTRWVRLLPHHAGRGDCSVSAHGLDSCAV